MYKFLQIFIAGTLLLASQFVHADSLEQPLDLNAFTGVWQDQNNPSHYYSVHYNAATQTLVLVDLSAIEATHDTLKSSYIGNISSTSLYGLLRSIKETNINPFINVTFKSDFTGTLGLSCGNLQDCVTYMPLIVMIKKIY